MALKDIRNDPALSSGVHGGSWKGQKSDPEGNAFLQRPRAKKGSVHFEDDLCPPGGQHPVGDMPSGWPQLSPQMTFFSDLSMNSENEGPEPGELAPSFTNKYFSTPVSAKARARKKLSPVMEAETTEEDNSTGAMAAPHRGPPCVESPPAAPLGTPLYRHSFAMECQEIVKQIKGSESDCRRSLTKRKAEELNVSSIDAEPPPYDSTPMKSLLAWEVSNMISSLDSSPVNGGGSLLGGGGSLLGCSLLDLERSDMQLQDFSFSDLDVKPIRGPCVAVPAGDGECGIKRLKLSPPLSEVGTRPRGSVTLGGQVTPRPRLGLNSPEMMEHAVSNVTLDLKYDTVSAPGVSSHCQPCASTTQDVMEMVNATLDLKYDTVSAPGVSSHCQPCASTTQDVMEMVNATLELKYDTISAPGVSLHCQPCASTTKDVMEMVNATLELKYDTVSAQGISSHCQPWASTTQDVMEMVNTTLDLKYDTVSAPGVSSHCQPCASTTQDVMDIVNATLDLEPQPLPTLNTTEVIEHFQQSLCNVTQEIAPVTREEVVANTTIEVTPAACTSWVVEEMPPSSAAVPGVAPLSPGESVANTTQVIVPPSAADTTQVILLKGESDATGVMEEPCVNTTCDVLPATEPCVNLTSDVLPAGEPCVNTTCDVLPAGEPCVNMTSDVEPAGELCVNTTCDVAPAGEPCVNTTCDVVPAGEPCVNMTSDVVPAGEPCVNTPCDVLPADEPCVNMTSDVVPAGEPCVDTCDVVAAGEPCVNMTSDVVAAGEPCVNMTSDVVAAGEPCVNTSCDVLPAGEPSQSLNSTNIIAAPPSNSANKTQDNPVPDEEIQNTTANLESNDVAVQSDLSSSANKTTEVPGGATDPTSLSLPSEVAVESPTGPKDTSTGGPLPATGDGSSEHPTEGVKDHAPADDPANEIGDLPGSAETPQDASLLSPDKDLLVLQKIDLHSTPEAGQSPGMTPDPGHRTPLGSIEENPEADEGPGIGTYSTPPTDLSPRMEPKGRLLASESVSMIQVEENVHDVSVFSAGSLSFVTSTPVPGLNNFQFQKSCKDSEPKDPNVSLGCVMEPPRGKEGVGSCMSARSKVMSSAGGNSGETRMGVSGLPTSVHRPPAPQMSGIPSARRSLAMFHQTSGQSQGRDPSKIPPRGLPGRGAIRPPLSRPSIPRASLGNTRQNTEGRGGIAAPSRIAGSSLRTPKVASAKLKSVSPSLPPAAPPSCYTQLCVTADVLEPAGMAPPPGMRSGLPKPGTLSQHPPPPPPASSQKPFVRPKSSLPGLPGKRPPRELPTLGSTRKVVPMKAEGLPVRRQLRPPSSAAALPKDARISTTKPSVPASRIQRADPPERLPPASGESLNPPVPLAETPESESCGHLETCSCCHRRFENLLREIEDLKRQLSRQGNVSADHMV